MKSREKERQPLKRIASDMWHLELWYRIGTLMLIIIQSAHKKTSTSSTASASLPSHLHMLSYVQRVYSPIPPRLSPPGTDTPMTCKRVWLGGDLRSLTLAKHPGSVGRKKKKMERQFVRKDLDEEINNKPRGGRRVWCCHCGVEWVSVGDRVREG